nr:flippase [Sphingomonas sp. JXJ CY 53]
MRQSVRVRQILNSRVTRSSTINIAGSIVPIVVAIPCLAALPRYLPTELFSLLLLAWALVGYAGILDLGLSRAVTLLVSRQQGANTAALQEILSTALFVSIASGLVGGAALLFGIDWLVSDILKTSPNVTRDAVTGFTLIACSIPLLLPHLVVQGFWDGRERFLESNIQRVAGGALPIVGATAMVVMVQSSFTAAAAGLLAGRALALALGLYQNAIWREIRLGSIRRQQLRMLMGFGSWVTVSGAISPLMGYLDRYVLAYARGSTIVAFYAAPSELVMKLLVLPVAVTRGLYPRLVASHAIGEEGSDTRHAYLLIAATCVPVAAGLALLAPFILHFWLGPVYAANSTGVVRVLAFGFLFSAFAQVPFTQLYAKGRPELIAMIHTGELLIFIPTAYLASLHFGPIGCAAAWTLRNLIDLLILLVSGKRAAWR